MQKNSKPLLLITLGDIAGVGPEIVVRAWTKLQNLCRPVIVGDLHWLKCAIELVELDAVIQPVESPTQASPTLECIPCISASSVDLSKIEPCRVSANAGRAAYDFLCAAIDLTLNQQAEGIVTLPLHKEGLHEAGLRYPGHTEILADRCGVKEHAMLLYVNGLGVAHVTLHMALRDVFHHLTTEAVLEKCHLLNAMLSRLLDHQPRLAVAALNPHASDGGLFGDEEEIIIQPAVKQAQDEGLHISGPWPTDTLFTRASQGEFDGVVAMYHDQGHIALKLLGEWRAVNITAGLPLIRTSVAHGTAYDIAWQGKASIDSLIEATQVAVRLCHHRE